MGILDDLLGSYLDESVSAQAQQYGNQGGLMGYGNQTGVQSLSNDAAQDINQQQLGGGMQGIKGQVGQNAVTPQFQSQQLPGANAGEGPPTSGGSGLIGGTLELLRNANPDKYRTEPMQAQTDNGAILGLMNMQQQQRQYNPYQDNRFRSLMSFGR